MTVEILVDAPNYVPGDLDSLWAYEIPTLGGGKMLLGREAAEQLGSLVSDASASASSRASRLYDEPHAHRTLWIETDATG